ncbi:MAG: alanine racemase [Lachnospirales bacterium]
MISSTYAIIDLDNLKDNYEEVKKYVNKYDKKVTVMPIIKANAYGHGAINIARFLRDISCEYFGVSSVKEAANLRKNSIKTPILVLSEVELGFIDYVIRENITISLFSYEYGKKISQMCELLGKRCKIHIKVDTGMIRVGIPYKEAIEEVIKIYSLDNLDIEGIYTHFATADEKDLTFLNLQYERFTNLLKEVENKGCIFKYKHISNSAGVFTATANLESDTINMVRPGLILYGCYPSEEVDKNKIKLKPLMSLRCKVIKVNEIDVGEGVSYGLTYIADKHMKIATISIGYGDGFPRGLSNKGYVEIKGVRAKILGRVCMDKTIVDISHIENVKINDEVIAIGNSISYEEVASLVDTSNYEIITRIQNRVTRIYKYQGEEYVASDDNFIF